MTSFQDKLNQLKPDQQSVLSPDYKKAIWNLFIGVGAVVDETYSWPHRFDRVIVHIEELHDNLADGLRFDYKRTLEMYDLIRKYGIDYEASSDPSPYTGSGFAGTFADEHPTVYGAGGKLVLLSGTECWWGVMMHEMTFSRLLNKVVLEFTLEEALENLLERLTSKHAEYTFKTTLNI